MYRQSNFFIRQSCYCGPLYCLRWWRAPLLLTQHSRQVIGRITHDDQQQPGLIHQLTFMPPDILPRALHRLKRNCRLWNYKSVFRNASPARRQASSPLIWFRNHNDVISIKIQSHVSRINCDSDVPTCGQNLVKGVRKVFFGLVKLYRVLKVKCRAWKQPLTTVCVWK